jgi:hypothetical protein
VIAFNGQRNVLEALRAANPVPDDGLEGTPPDPESVDRTRARVSELAHDAPLGGDGARTRPTPRPLIRIAATCLVGALCLGAAALSPPGRAVAERLGELVGIGDEPSRSRELPFDEKAVVIGVGTSPNGTAYEIVAARGMPSLFRNPDPDTCISLDLPDIYGPANAACLTDQFARSIERQVVAPIAFLGSPELGSDRLIVNGMASTEVASAEIEHRTEAGDIERFPVQVTRLEGELASRISASRDAAYLVSFLPEDLVPAPGSPGVPRRPSAARPLSQAHPSDSPAADALARITLVAYDSEGEEIAREALDSHPFSAFTLYEASRGHRPEAAARTLEKCLRRVLPEFGRSGKLAPELRSRVERAVNDCVKQRGR